MTAREDAATGALLARLDAALREDPALAGRTLAVLHGRLGAPGLEAVAVAKGSKTQTTVRYPEGLLARAEALVPRLQQDPLVGSLRQVSRSTVLILALMQGLDVLEVKYAPAGRRPKR